MKIKLISTYHLEVDEKKMKEDDLKAFIQVAGTLGLNNALALYGNIKQVTDEYGEPIVEHKLER